MTDNGHISPPLDLETFRRRYAKIMEERQRARTEAEEQGIEEGEADFRYHKQRAIAFAHFRGEDMGVTEAEIRANGSEKVVTAKLERHTAMVLRKAAEERLAELEANRAMLRAEAQMSEGIEFTGTAA